MKIKYKKESTHLFLGPLDLRSELIETSFYSIRGDFFINYLGILFMPEKLRKENWTGLLEKIVKGWRVGRVGSFR